MKNYLMILRDLKKYIFVCEDLEKNLNKYQFQMTKNFKINSVM